ncbi:DUF1254 domain-containing protein [Rhodococcus sp. NPDC056506]|uniref:DUF1254 domain-containing protein n=1 Tax=Rhodococcus sp. NPDC056506 TaxID=3345844 RepID=UPI00366BB016
MGNSRWTNLANAPLEGGYPTAEAATALREEMVFQRGVQLYEWALPAVALESMRLACGSRFGFGCTTLTSWRRIGAEALAVTSNPDVSYAFAWLDLKQDGPTVIEAAPHLQGLVDDAWQRPVTDIGLAGPDQGAGGKYLIVPPGHTDPLPDGYFVCHSRTFRVLVFLRGFFTPEDPDAGLAQINATSIYPLSGLASPPPMNRVDAAGVAIDMLPPADHTYFTMLAEILDYEPADREDFTMRGLAATVGVVAGRQFAPDPTVSTILDAAASVGEKYGATVSFNPSDHLRVWPERRWTSNMIPGPHVTADPEFNTATYQDFDERLTFFYSAFSTSDAMFLAMPGKGAQYAGAFFDVAGDRPMGENVYSLHIPADVPVVNYWSLVLYDTVTRCLIDNGAGSPSIASNQNLTLNADGSADLHFGPEAPADGKNWIKTVPGRGWFAALRLYGPTQAFFDRRWTPGDITRTN